MHWNALYQCTNAIHRDSHGDGLTQATAANVRPDAEYGSMSLRSIIWNVTHPSWNHPNNDGVVS